MTFVDIRIENYNYDLLILDSFHFTMVVALSIAAVVFLDFLNNIQKF